MKYIIILFAAWMIVSCQPSSKSENNEHESATSSISQAPTPSPVPTKDTLCYESRFSKEVFSLMLIITNDREVEGTLNYVFEEKDSAYGTLKGRKSGNIIDADYTFTIEGSQQTEVVEFKMEDDRILRKIGPLVEKEGKLMLQDSEKSTFAETFMQIDCANSAISNSN